MKIPADFWMPKVQTWSAKYPSADYDRENTIHQYCYLGNDAPITSVDIIITGIHVFLLMALVLIRSTTKIRIMRTVCVN